MTESRAEQWKALLASFYDARTLRLIGDGYRLMQELEAELAAERVARELAEAKLDKLAINFGEDYKLANDMPHAPLSRVCCAECGRFDCMSPVL